MAKNKHWIYQDANGCTVGLMKCCGCGKKITSGEFRYYDSGDAYVCQCKACGGGDTKWMERDRQHSALVHKQWKEDARTDHDVLLQRIKDAWNEGYEDGGCEFGDPTQDRAYAWEVSNAKRVHDVLRDLWRAQ